MLNLLKFLRYLIFVIFVICNAIITSVAVWNLSIVQSLPSEVTVKDIDSFLIFVGASGLLLIFIVIFFEIYGKNVVLVRVWFELLWVGLYALMELVGAALITSQSGSTCTIPTDGTESPCPSIQVLQAFTWICATLLLGYFTVLAILTVVRWKDDPTIWDCAVKRFPVIVNNYYPAQIQHQHAKKPSAPSSLLSRFSGNRVPIIAAPTPRRAAVLREPILSYRSGLSMDYEIEHYQSPESVLSHGMSSEEHRQQPLPLAGASLQPQRRSITQNLMQIPEQPKQEAMTLPALIPSPFYHSSVQTALDNRIEQVQAQLAQKPEGNEKQSAAVAEQIRPLPPVHVDQRQIRRLPPSPPPLGEWPRQNPSLPTPKATRSKRKPLPQPDAQPEVESQPHFSTSPFANQTQTFSHSSPPQEQSSSQTARQGPQAPPMPPRRSSKRRETRPLPAVQPSHSSYPVDPSELPAALQPLASPSFRSKLGSRPSGPRHKSTSIDEGIRTYEFGSL